MPSYGRTSTVRSHRRGGPRRRIALAPWLIIGSVVALVGAGVTAGYAYIINGVCSGSAEATVVVSPRISSIMKQLSVDWAQTAPSVNGACGSITIVSKESFRRLKDLGAGGHHHDGVWPTSGADPRAWVRKASVLPWRLAHSRTAAQPRPARRP
jgi:hypothetical protein